VGNHDGTWNTRSRALIPLNLDGGILQGRQAQAKSDRFGRAIKTIVNVLY
jgi:hypothetical protein